MTKESWRIRPATISDVPGVLPMVRAIYELHQEWDPAFYDVLPDVLERYARWLPGRVSDPRSVFLVADDLRGDPTPAAYLVATTEPNIPVYRTREFGFIHDVWVEPSLRQRGVARALVAAAVERFAAVGISQIRMETARVNDTARAAFAGAGFRVATMHMVHIADAPR